MASREGPFPGFPLSSGDTLTEVAGGDRRRGRPFRTVRHGHTSTVLPPTRGGRRERCRGRPV